MQNNYKLSIIIPHYNSPGLLEKLLSTIPNRNEIQTIVVDDHSSEEVKEELKTLQTFYRQSGTIFLENDTEEHNAGAARNIGLEKAKGEWLLFADADDFFLDGFYEAIEEYFDTDYDIVFFPPTSLNLDTGDIGIRNQSFCGFIKAYLEKANNLTEAKLRYQWRVPWSKLIKKSVVELNGITFDSVRYCNDIMFSMKTGFFARKISVSEKAIYCVTRNKGSLTTYLDKETFEMRAMILIDQFQFLKTHLSKKEFKASEAYRIAWGQLLLIFRRHYGVGFFLKYLKIFSQNKMLKFDVRIFTRIKPRKMIKDRNKEKEIRDRYTICEK